MGFTQPGYVKIAIENGPVESSYEFSHFHSMVMFQFAMLVSHYQRVMAPLGPLVNGAADVDLNGGSTFAEVADVCSLSLRLAEV